MPRISSGAGAAEKRRAGQVALDDVGPLIDDPAHVGLRVLGAIRIKGAVPRDVGRVQSERVDVDRIGLEREQARVTAGDRRRRLCERPEPLEVGRDARSRTAGSLHQ